MTYCRRPICSSACLPNRQTNNRRRKIVASNRKSHLTMILHLPAFASKFCAIFAFHGENRRRTLSSFHRRLLLIVLRIEQDRIWRMQPREIATVRCLIFAQTNIDYRKKCGKVVDSNFSLVLATEYTILMGIPPAEQPTAKEASLNCLLSVFFFGSHQLLLILAREASAWKMSKLHAHVY